MNLYLLLYKALLPHRYRRYLERAGGDVDMCHEALLHGTFYEEYRLYGFALKGESERRTYLTDAVRDSICRRVNSRAGDRIVMDKSRTARHFARYFHRQVVPLSIHTLDQAVQLGVDEGALVLKPVDQCGGRGIRLLEADGADEWQQLLAPLAGGRQRYLLEQRIRQHPFLAQFNSSSVNTIRINTILRNATVTHFTAFMLVGRSGHFVNNGAQGGLFASIDTTIGRIITDGFDEQGVRHPVHPDSGVAFLGQEVPQWDSLLTLTREMALLLPSTAYLSWDMVLTPDGWEPLEANRGEFVAQQVTLGRGLRPDFERLLNASPGRS